MFKDDICRAELVTEALAQFRGAHDGGFEGIVVAVRSFSRPSAPTLELLSQMRVPHFLLLAATDPCGPEYLDRLSSDMMRRTLVGVKGAEENVRFLEEVVRLAHAGRPKPEGVPVFVLDDNVKHLRLKLSDSGGWRSAVDLTNIQTDPVQAVFGHRLRHL